MGEPGTGSGPRGHEDGQDHGDRPHEATLGAAEDANGYDGGGGDRRAHDLIVTTDTRLWHRSQGGGCLLPGEETTTVPGLAARRRYGSSWVWLGCGSAVWVMIVPALGR